MERINEELNKFVRLETEAGRHLDKVRGGGRNAGEMRNHPLVGSFLNSAAGRIFPFATSKSSGLAATPTPSTKGATSRAMSMAT